MKVTQTQPLEHTTPVVPETQATTDDRTAAGRSGSPGDDDCRDEASSPPADGESTDPSPSSDAFPEPPTGSAGHP